METIICDISAFQYWRIPPVVRLLTEAPPDDSLLLNLVDDEELERLRAGRAELPPRARLLGVRRALAGGGPRLP